MDTEKKSLFLNINAVHISSGIPCVLLFSSCCYATLYYYSRLPTCKLICVVMMMMVMMTLMQQESMRRRMSIPAPIIEKKKVIMSWKAFWWMSFRMRSRLGHVCLSWIRVLDVESRQMHIAPERGMGMSDPLLYIHHTKYQTGDDGQSNKCIGQLKWHLSIILFFLTETLNRIKPREYSRDTSYDNTKVIARDGEKMCL